MEMLDGTQVTVALIGGLASILVVWLPMRWGKKTGARSSVQSPPDNDHAPDPLPIDVIDAVRKMRLEMHERFDSVDSKLRKRD